jgi:hypothetical protein
VILLSVWAGSLADLVSAALIRLSFGSAIISISPTALLTNFGVSGITDLAVIRSQKFMDKIQGPPKWRFSRAKNDPISDQLRHRVG